MPRFTHAQRDQLIATITAAAGRRLGGEVPEALQAFLSLYFTHVPLGDIVGESPDTLFGLAFSHWRLTEQRRPGVPAVRVYNPKLEEHGWRCEHSVIEVVTENMPFLVDSVTNMINRLDLAVQLVIHPVISVDRDESGALRRVETAKRGGEAEGGIEESLMHFQITRQADDMLPPVAEGVGRTLAEVRTVVADWQAMLLKGELVIADMAAAEGVVPDDAIDEAREFLRWLLDNNFTFLGYRAYAFAAEGDETVVRIDADSGLGVLKDTALLVFDDLCEGRPVPPPVRAFEARPDVIMVAKANRTTTVHRPVHMDAIVVKRFADGRMVGEHMIVGLFAAAAYNRSVRSIPLLRGKLTRLLARAGFDPRGHDGRALANIVETFPRDELFQVSDDHLYYTTLGILHLQQRQRIALFIRRDDFERYVSCLIYIPRERYNTDLRRRIEAILAKAFGGRVTAHYTHVADSPHARLQVFVRTTPGQIPEYDPARLEAEIVAASRTWADNLLRALLKAHGEEKAHRLNRLYGHAFPPGYCERFIAEEAVEDIGHIEQALATGRLQTTLYRPFGALAHQMRLKIYHPEAAIVLSLVMPMLENLGLRVIDEVPHAVRVGRDGGPVVQLHDFGLETRSGRPIDLGAVRNRFQEAFLAVWNGEVEGDQYNALVLEAGLAWPEVVIIRAYSRYLRQTGIAFSQAYMQQTLCRHADMARRIIALFRALFDPAASGEAEARAAPVRAEITAGLEAVASADEDRILRRFVNAVEATLRTSYFRHGADGGRQPYLAFKLDSRQLDELPLPRPMVEIFVYSPRMEGVHLRAGKVARGGIRWSDRREDFRTEVLGLMKAQNVKNTVIVPVGAKGGFVVKRLPDPGDREAVQAEGIACYRMLIQGMLDLTDNRVGDAIEPPPSVVRRDDDDPYLVVAADKGTATFSDIANGIAKDYGFWLGDAFASGGSQGYDHKKMGITARGAWESVKRHFRELGHNIQETPFTVIGVGDMSGDVFGNGMLLSPHIRLLAAFNHQHIFVDPDPDTAVSFGERRRLFDLPRSTWRDYDPELISTGGGVFDRRAKSITLTPEINARFGLSQSRMTPGELIRHLLRAEADLLWFGGIGTFVKATHESHGEVGDRANDSLRVDGRELRCKVIGEGANLGVTQRGRIEFGRHGGRINTDFIDNSAGVDCSDHEVNIKILLDAAVADGDMTEKQRNQLLAEMTDEVADLVLRDNYLQSQAISLVCADGFAALENQARLIRMLERQGRLHREVEALPDEDDLAERIAARHGLTRPEIAVVFSYCKIWLYEEVLETSLPDERHLARDVERYFPGPIQARFGDRIAGHRLRRELVATSIINSLINRMGGTFAPGIADKTGMSAADIARAYIIARDVFAARAVWEGIEALDNGIAASVQTVLHREVQRLIERGTLWFLAN
ncbi:MAG: NAD-glutamate dehydrogenase, partial [Rhodospirillales bacterium]